MSHLLFASSSAASDLILAAQDRPRGVTWVPGELEGGIVLLIVGCALAVGVFKLVPRVPWPRHLNWRFIGFHVLAAPAAAGLWQLITWPLGMLVGAASDIPQAERAKEMMVIGSIFYVIFAGLAYSADGAARAAKAEASAAKTQLATLRSQLQPHFLFNSLHTIVQLTHIDPRRASEAAELVAELLRRTLEEQRDEVPLRDEWRFVLRYLEVEQMRFGERLIVTADLPDDMQSERVPSFALQTLVENAVQHGAAPRVAPTEIAITATRSKSELRISVRNTGDVDAPKTDGLGTGTGLARLRERLSVLYAGAARLNTQSVAAGGYDAVLTIPRNGSRDS